MTQKTRRFMLYGVWAVAALLGANAFRLRDRVAATDEIAIAPVPYTLVKQILVTSADGKTTRGGRRTLSMRSDGAFLRRIETDGPEGSERQKATRTIWLPGQNVTIQVDDVAERKATVTGRHSGLFPALRTPSSNCLNGVRGQPVTSGQVVLPPEVVDGIDTVKVSIGKGIHWFAPSLACAEVKLDMWDGANTSEIVSIARGEPDPLLFAVPTRYQEVELSDLKRGGGAGAGGPSRGRPIMNREGVRNR
jgi:hypothetical protein